MKTLALAWTFALAYLGCASSTLTLGEYCNDVGTTLCARFESCSQPVTGCLDTFNGACCKGDACKVLVNDSRLTSCETAITSLTCDQLINSSTVPVACQ